MILLGIFTLAESYLVSSVCAIYTPESVLQAAVVTAAATCGLTWYAWTTKNDFTEFVHYFYGNLRNYKGFCWSFGMILLWLTLLDVFYLTKSTFVMNLYCIIFAIIYSIYILIDTQLVMGGKNTQLTLDNYVFGAMILYIDIIGLFLKLLQLFGKRR